MIFKRVRKGITYIYERTTVDGKRHEKVIGKVDENGKEIYYDNRASGGKGRGRREKIPEISTETSRVEILIMELSKIGRIYFSKDKNTNWYSYGEKRKQ